ncbi:unnamed protein product [Ectocarpus fasciculatus]
MHRLRGGGSRSRHAHHTKHTHGVSVRVCGDGHGYREQDGHRDGAAGMHRRSSRQLPAPRASEAGAKSQGLRERFHLEPGGDVPHVHRGRPGRPQGGEKHLGGAHHRGRVDRV